MSSNHLQASDARPEPSLLDQLRDRLRVKHYSIRTEQAYVEWTRRFILFHDKAHPRQLGPKQVEAFLTHLAVRGRVAASTQNQAKSAILFLYREVIDRELPWLESVVVARATQWLPVVLTQEEVEAVLGCMRGTPGLIAKLLYGSGLRILECLRLRVKDIDFSRKEIVVRDGKHAKDRMTMLPGSLVEPLGRHLERVRDLHADAPIGAPCGWYPQARDAAYPSAFIRDPSAPVGLRHSDGAGAARSQRREHDDDLYACAQPRRARRPQSARSMIGRAGGTDLPDRRA